MRVRVAAFAAIALWSVAIVAAQKVTTVEELDKTMKKVGPASQGMGKAAASGAWADVRTHVATMKQATDGRREFLGRQQARRRREVHQGHAGEDRRRAEARRD